MIGKLVNYFFISPSLPHIDMDLFQACSLGSPHDVKSLLNSGHKAINCNGIFSSIHAAAQRPDGYKFIAELIDIGGANINAKSKRGYTPLELTISSFYNTSSTVEKWGYYNTAVILLQKGANKYSTRHGVITDILETIRLKHLTSSESTLLTHK